MYHEYTVYSFTQSTLSNFCSCFHIFHATSTMSFLTERISGAAVTSSTNLPIEGNSVNLTCDAAV